MRSNSAHQSKFRIRLTRSLIGTVIAFVAVAALLTFAVSASRQQQLEHGSRKESGAKNAAAPKPLSPLAPSITATLTDNVAAATKVAPGGTINYTAVITNAGASPADDATNLNFSAPLDTNTTLTPGTVHASPIAFNDTYNWVGNTFLDSSARALASVTANDVTVNPPGGGDTFTVTTLTNAPTTLSGTVSLAF